MRRAFYGRRRVIRCIQLFYYTDLSTGYVVSGGKNLISELYLIIAVAVLLFAGVSFIFFNKKTSEFDFTPGKGMFLLSLLCAAGMFYDFIYQCVSCYDYISKNVLYSCKPCYSNGAVHYFRTYMLCLFCNTKSVLTFKQI